MVRFSLLLANSIGHADRILDGVGVRRSVADDAHALDAQQRRAAVFGVVEPLLEIGKRLARQQKSNLAADRRLQRLLQQEAHRLHHAFGNLQRDVADEAVANQHVGLAVVKVAAFDVADEIHRQLFDQLVGFASKLVALALFFADGKQADARMLGAGKPSGKNACGSRRRP